MSRISSQDPSAEFSRLVPLDAIGDEEVERRIEATAEERRALARRLSLLSLDRLSATLRLRRPDEGALVSVEGRFEAEVTQTCVVSLAPVRTKVAQDLSLLYSLVASDEPVEAPVDIDIDLDDPPETVGPEGLDLGEAVVQQLAVSLDPYPRAAEARLERADWGRPDADEEDQGSSPFRVLETLKGG